jgi:hypothetical protein
MMRAVTGGCSDTSCHRRRKHCDERCEGPRLEL